MIGYKAFNEDWTCRGFQYEIGKTYELSESETIEICKCGFHFCKNPIDVLAYYPLNDKTKIAEIVALGKVQQEGTKYCTDKIKIVKEFTREQLQALILDSKYNTGKGNGGYGNSGNLNSGDFNSGYRNSGHFNSGDSNSGNRNVGDINSGDGNFGDSNSGSRNFGNFNSGNRNFGNLNSGDSNSGNFNSGNFNSGNFNSGNFNSGNFNSGIFNTDEPYMRAFNRATTIRYSDFILGIDYNFADLCRRISKKSLEAGDIDRIRALPNFDAKIFREITGIDIDTERREGEKNEQPIKEED